MAITAAQNRKQTPRLPVAAMLVSLACYLIVFPLSAWHHNAMLVVASVAIPLAFAQVRVYRSGQTPFVGLLTTKHTIKFLVMMVVGILIWNHQWQLALILLVIDIFLSGKSMDKK